MLDIRRSRCILAAFIPRILIGNLYRLTWTQLEFERRFTPTLSRPVFEHQYLKSSVGYRSMTGFLNVTIYGLIV